MDSGRGGTWFLSVDSFLSFGHDAPVGDTVPSSMKRETLTLQGRLPEIGRASHFVADFCRSEGLDSSQERVLVLILEELITNTVKHGSPPVDAPIHVSLARDGGEIHISYRDSGTPFDPNHDAPAPDLSDTLSRRRAGGLGWPLIRHYCSSIGYSRQDECNCLELSVPTGAGRVAPPG